MPLVRIDTLRMPHEQFAALSDAVAQALVDTIDIPADDLFHVLTNHDGTGSTLRHGTYLDVPHDDGIVYIDITLRAGRSDEKKKALYRRLGELTSERARIEPHNLFVVLHENSDADWSIGYGRAQFLP